MLLVQERRLVVTDSIFVPPDPEPTLPEALERFRYAHAVSKQDPMGLLVSTYCVLHDLIELLVRADVIKLSDLEQIKKDTFAAFRAAQIIVSH